ncbi:MAG: alpha-galactosidase, partial [Pseudomonadota bacterium]
IEYIKWDHNRVLPVSDAAQTYGIYDVFARLRAAHPKVEIENCSSGGGRIDLGMMEFTQRVWLSDSNDAVERARIQHDSALFLPGAITGSHVGPRTCHTSGRKLNIKLRAWTAAQRHMGFEMDPRELTDDEAESLTLITGWWKENRSWMMGADILRLDTEDAAVLAEQQISVEGHRFVVFRTQISNSTQISPRLLRLTGLEPDAVYEINLLNKADGSHLSRGALELKSGPVRLTGQSLMARGIALPWAFPETIWVLEGHKI